jgi:NADH-quinone oxidoreductase subunit G
VPEARAQMQEVGPWDGARAAAAAPPVRHDRKVLKTKLALASWKQLLDNGSLQEGDANLRATARPAVAKVAQETFDMLKHADEVILTGDRGSVTLPMEVADLATGTIWVPANSFGNGVLADLASPGSQVSVKGVRP